MSLEEYQNKRDFRKTPEPKGKKQRTSSAPQFVVQKHDARSLHYDLRLEVDGVLKSWAVPKGPSLDPSDKVLAIAVEDHPLEYGDFEGVIPAGEYGGGTVMLWDHGPWHAEGDAEGGIRDGKLTFTLQGEKLAGEWALVRMRGKSGDGGKNWLLIKHKDKYAKAGKENDPRETKPNSVLSGRTMNEIAEDPDRVWSSNNKSNNKQPKGNKKSSGSSSKKKGTMSTGLRPARLSKARRQTQPKAFRPLLPTLIRKPPKGNHWLHELKYDGYRIITIVRAGKAKLLSRRGNDWTDRFKLVAEKIEAMAIDQAILDGEIVVLRRDGTSDFQALQNVMKSGRQKDLVYYLFDLPHFEGYDLTDTPLIERKELLAELLSDVGSSGTIRYGDHIEGEGEPFLAEACRHGAEGIVSKRAESGYVQSRSKAWVKLKCLKRQEFVIGGYTEPSGSRKRFGALVLGYYENKKLIYCGRVGTGFTNQSLEQIAGELIPLERKRPPFSNPPTAADARDVHWVKPELVAEVEFGEWTDDGILRHPSFQGMREDKDPKEIIREEASSQPAEETMSAQKKSSQDPGVRIAGIRLSNPDRVLYPEQGITKVELAEYYEAVADWILPHVVDRPLAVVRCPSGRRDKCFFQKHFNESIPSPIRGIEVDEEDGGKETHLAVDDVGGLVMLAQLGVLEIHPWGSRKDRLDRPDRIVLDLDPGEGVPWTNVVDAAHAMRERLEEMGLVSFVRTTGGKGLHVVIPIDRRSTWDEVKQFAKDLAERFVRTAPKHFIAVSTKSKRKGKIYIDYLRNGRGATAIANYSTRAREGGTVATPVRWDELTPTLAPNEYHVRNIIRRLSSLSEFPWEGFFDVRQSLTKAVMEAVKESR